MIKKILNIAFWVIFAIILTIWLVDFFRVRSDNDPIFCLYEKEHKYEDGEVYECIGLGYKVYEYNRESLDKGLEFGPIFIKMRQPN